MDVSSDVAVVGALISAVSAIIAIRQAQHAKDSARSAKSQAASTLRQAESAADDVLLTRLRMSAKGDDALAEKMFSARKVANAYIELAAGVIYGALKFNFKNVENGKDQKLLERAYGHYVAVAEEDSVSRVIDFVHPRMLNWINEVNNMSEESPEVLGKEIVELEAIIAYLLGDPIQFDHFARHIGQH